MPTERFAKTLNHNEVLRLRYQCDGALNTREIQKRFIYYDQLYLRRTHYEFFNLVSLEPCACRVVWVRDHQHLHRQLSDTRNDFANIQTEIYATVRCNRVQW